MMNTQSKSRSAMVEPELENARCPVPALEKWINPL